MSGGREFWRLPDPNEPTAVEKARSLSVAQLRTGIEIAEERGDLMTLEALRREYRNRKVKEGLVRRTGGRVAATS